MREVFPFALQNAQIVPTEKIPIPTQGRGVFTTIKVVGSIPLFLEKHVARVTDHAQHIGISVSLSPIANYIQHVLTANSTITAAVRISVLENGEVLLHCTTLPPTGEYITAVTYESSEFIPMIKQLDRSMYAKAEGKAHANDSDTPVFMYHNNFLESSISNIVSIDSHGELVTPILKEQGLKGITRQILLEKEILTEEEIRVTTDQPLVLINSLRVQAVASLNGKKLPDPTALLKRVKEYIREEETSYEDTYHR